MTSPSLMHEIGHSKPVHWDSQRDGIGREVGGGFMFGIARTPMVDSCQCMAKPRQYCKVINLQIKENGNLDYGCEDIFLDSQFYPIDPCVSLCATITLVDHCSSVVTFEIRKCVL